MNASETRSVSNIGALIVNKKTLAEARDKARCVSRGLHQIENLSDLDWGELNALCRTRLVILKLPLSVQRLFDSNELPITLAPLLTRIAGIDRQERLANLVASLRLTVPKLKEMVDRIVLFLQPG